MTFFEFRSTLNQIIDDRLFRKLNYDNIFHYWLQLRITCLELLDYIYELKNFEFPFNFYTFITIDNWMQFHPRTNSASVVERILRDTMVVNSKFYSTRR